MSLETLLLISITVFTNNILLERWTTDTNIPPVVVEREQYVPVEEGEPLPPRSHRAANNAGDVFHIVPIKETNYHGIKVESTNVPKQKITKYLFGTHPEEPLFSVIHTEEISVEKWTKEKWLECFNPSLISPYYPWFFADPEWKPLKRGD